MDYIALLSLGCITYRVSGAQWVFVPDFCDLVHLDITDLPADA